MTIEKLDDLIKHNINLVRTAARMRDSLQAAHKAITMVVDLAEPEQREEEPTEYIIHADNLDALRQVLIDYRTPA